MVCNHGSREKGGASEAAARSMVQSAATLSTRVLSYLNANGPATTDETAAALEVSVLAVRPRFSELLLRGSIEKTAERRRNEPVQCAPTSSERSPRCARLL